MGFHRGLWWGLVGLHRVSQGICRVRDLRFFARRAFAMHPFNTVPAVLDPCQLSSIISEIPYSEPRTIALRSLIKLELGVLLVGSWDFNFLGFYMNHNREAKSLTFRKGFRSPPSEALNTKCPATPKPELYAQDPKGPQP